MKVRFIIEDTIFLPSVIGGDKPTKRIFRLIDDTRVESVETAEGEVRELVNAYNETYNEKEKADGCKERRKFLRIIDEQKLMRCPTGLVWDSYPRQELQGRCPDCDYKFIDFFNRGEQQPKHFKYCHGFGQSRVKDLDRIVVFECPECFLKSYFHCNDNWYELYGEWIVDNSIFLKESTDEKGEGGEG